MFNLVGVGPVRLLLCEEDEAEALEVGEGFEEGGLRHG